MDPKVLTVDGLVSAFYEAYDAEEDPKPYAQEIVDRDKRDEMWNWPTVVVDARDELSD